MKNCLVTKLKGSVDNPNLSTLGEILIPVSAGSTIHVPTSRFVVGSDNTIELISGNATATYDGSPVSFPIEIEGEFTTPIECDITAITDCVISIRSKYNIQTLNDTSDWDVDTESFEYSPINRFKGLGQSTHMHGDIKYLIHIDNLDNEFSIATHSNKLYGDLAEIGNMLNVTTIQILFTDNIKGSLEKLVAKYVGNSRTSGTINMVINSNLVTFNGSFVPRTGLTSKVLSWQQNATAGRTDVTWDGTTIVIDNATGNVVS